MSSYRRWVKDEEDVDRLPHGMIRTAYDADVRQYTFFDTTSNTNYVSAPGEAYGTLVPAATANFPMHSRSNGRRRTLQAYDRPVLFADDMTVQRQSSPSKGHKGDPKAPPSSHHRSSTTVRKHKRSASFSDILPPHLIASASQPQNAAPSAYVRGMGGIPSPKSAPPLTSSRSPSPYQDEKKSPWWSPTADLPSLPPVPPPKTDSPVFFGEKGHHQHHGSGGGAHVTLRRATTRMLGRTWDAVRGGFRSRSGRPSDEGWVVV